MKADIFPLPHTGELLEEFKGGKLFSTLDIFSEYRRVPLSEKCKNMTTFTCPLGTYKLEVMPLGLITSPATFKRNMKEILKGFKFTIYLDGAVIFSETIQEHIGHPRGVVKLLSESGLSIKPENCTLFHK